MHLCLMLSPHYSPQYRAAASVNRGHSDVVRLQHAMAWLQLEAALHHELRKPHVHAVSATIPIKPHMPTYAHLGSPV